MPFYPASGLRDGAFLTAGLRQFLVAGLGLGDPIGIGKGQQVDVNARTR